MTIYRRRAETKKFIINCKTRFFTQEWVLSCSRPLTKIESGIVFPTLQYLDVIVITDPPYIIERVKEVIINVSKGYGLYSFLKV